MTDLNNVTLIGRLTRDLGSDEYSFGFLPNGSARATVSIAVNRSKKQGEEWVDETSFFDVTFFGKQAENLKPYLTKGSQIAVEGYLKQDRWEKDGQKHSRISIIANHVQLIGGRKDGANSSDKKFEPVNSNGAVNNYSTNVPVQSDSFYGDSGFQEDIPF